MRKLVVSNFMSLDGYFSGPDGDVMALPFDPTFDDYNAERVRTADTLVAGRTTFEQLMAFWVPLAEAPEASDVEREIGRFQRDVDKLVVSDSLPAEGAPYGATVVRRDEIGARLTELKRQPGLDILVFGSHITWNSLLQAGHVDEVHLMVGSAAIGGGTPLFTASTPRLRLLDVIRQDSSDNVVLTYATDTQR